MKAEERRKEILAIVGNSDNALPAAVLAEKLGVSRQVIVQDIAMLRANGFDIISTNRGYMLTAKRALPRACSSAVTPSNRLWTKATL